METRTVEAPAGAAVAANGSPIVQAQKGGAVETMQEVMWTKERIEAIRRQIVPPACSNDEFVVFLEQCKRTHLDPLVGEAFCVPRGGYQEVPIPGQPDRFEKKWVTKYVFQPGEQGMEARADRFPDFRGIRFGAYYSNDKISIDKVNGRVEHIYNPVDDQRGTLIGAWAIVDREGRHPTVVDVLLSERLLLTKENKPQASWRNPKGQIEKCSRMAALRLAYPNTFGGLYIAGELPELEPDEVDVAPKTQEQHETGRTRTAAVASTVKAQAQRAKKEPELEDAQVTEPAPEKPPEATIRFGNNKGISPEATIRFGNKKGISIVVLPTPELEQLKAEAETKLLKAKPEDTWKSALQMNLQQIDAELRARAERIASAAQRSSREPGEDDVEIP